MASGILQMILLSDTGNGECVDENEEAARF